MTSRAFVATPAAVTLARVARGLTQQQLAKTSLVSQAYLSKVEKGGVELVGDRLIAVADALGYPLDYFAADPDAAPAPAACAFTRKRSSLPTSAEKRIRALLEITRMQVEPLLDELTPQVTLPRRDSDDEWDSGIDMAIAVRKLAALPSGPIPNLVEFLENMGVIVVTRELGNRLLDAIGQWPQRHRPLMLINAAASADRRRFTLAHELGHAVLHIMPQPDQETEADEFASELLLPADEGRDLFDNSLDLARLAELKPVWGMSMAALTRRAFTLGRITEYRYKQLNIDLSAAGYRTKEPVALATETPRLLTAALARRHAAGESRAELAARARMTENELTALYLEAS